MNYGTYMEEYDKPSLNIVMNPKESNGAVAAIKFSNKGDYLVVSFDNEKKENYETLTTNFDRAFIQLYVKRHS